MKKRILITGGSGKIASVLTNLKGELTFTDIVEPTKNSTSYNYNFIKGDLANKKFSNDVVLNHDIIIHLAASSSPMSRWEDVQKNNITAFQYLMDAAIKNNVEKIIFASSNHVVGMYEIENAEVYHNSNENKNKISENSPPRPDSFYGVSKLFGENLGRYYSDKYGINFISLRIGSILDKEHDHPFGYAEIERMKENIERGDIEYQKLVNRLKSTWLSRRDFLQIIEKSINYQDTSFEIFNSISDNHRAWLSIDKAKQILDYSPIDDAEKWKKFK